MNKIFKSLQRVVLGLFIMVINIGLIGCSDNNVEDTTEHTFTSKNISFINCEEDFDVDDVDDVTLYFIDEGSVPYIDVTTFISIIDPMSQIDASDIIMDESHITITYDPVPYKYQFIKASKIHSKDSQYRQKLEIDFETDIVYVSSYLFFMYQGVEQLSSDSDTVRITDVSIDQGEPIEIPFSEYGFDFIVKEPLEKGGYLIPFHIASLLFNYDSIYKTYYNGDAIYGGGFCLYRDQEVRTSSLNGTDIPEDVRQASLNTFTLSLDYFSAIKQARNINSYQDLYVDDFERIIDTQNQEYYTELSKLLYEIDDLHAGLPAQGYYSSAPNDALSYYQEWFQTNRINYFETLNEYRNVFQSTFINSEFPPFVQLVGDDTAILYLYQFTEQTAVEVQQNLDQLPSSIEHVVFDVSMNGGGNVHSIFELLGFMTNDPIVFDNKVAIDGSTRTYTVEVDQEAYGYNWFIRTSPVSFSASNIFALLAKDNNIATIIGEPSSGGSSPIESIILPCGFSYTISGNDTFYSSAGSAEFGVDVDWLMENIWDENEVYNIIHQP